MDKNCLYCDKPFVAKKAEVKRGRGKYCSPECSQLAQKSKRVNFTPEWRKNMATAMKGKRFTEEHKKKIGLAHKGRKYPLRNQAQENNQNWKGDSVGYMGLHKWIQKMLGKAKYCAIDLTHKGPYQWANISGEYKREISDFRQLCAKCNLNDGIKIHPRFKI